MKIVSRETQQRFEEFETAVLKWNTTINLVSASQSRFLKHRHILDSAQIAEVVDFPKIWLDMGSGGGFPGIVMAIIAKERAPETRFCLVESDRRKCAFLMSVASQMDLRVTVHPNRIEAFEGPKAGVISARALAPLSQLISWSRPFATEETVGIFPKGQTHLEELKEAQNQWTFDAELVQSQTDSSAAIIKIRNFV